jgi:phosphatidylinositol glycan class V
MENELAFYPGFPLLIRALSLPPFSPDVIANFLPSFFYLLSSVVLYRLTLQVGYTAVFARRVSLFWAISPISIFSFAPYTESMFCFFSFLGMLQWVRGLRVSALLCFVVAAGTRSNGVFLAGFFCWSVVGEMFPIGDCSDGMFVGFVRSFRQSPRMKVRVGNIVCAILCVVPSAAFAWFANWAFCPGLVWCGQAPYGYVQAKYWGVGFLRYWKLRQLPNLMLAVPITSFVVILCLKERGSNQKVRLPFVLHLVGLLVISLCFAHVQVTTRVLLAGSPAAWWALAQSPRTPAILFSVVYMNIGIALFVNFLPWT